MNDTDAYGRVNHYDSYAIDLSKVYYSKIIREAKHASAKPGKMLDVGCYDGTLGEMFLKDGWKVHGIEAHDKASATARSKGLEVIKTDIENGLPYPDNFFDLIIAAEIIEHLYDTDKFLDEIKRILTPEGTLIVTIPNVASATNRLRLLLGLYPRFCEYQAGTSGGHIRVYTKGAILDQLRQHSFKIMTCCGANLPCPMAIGIIPNFIKKIAIRLGDFTPSIAGQIIIAAANTKQYSKE